MATGTASAVSRIGGAVGPAQPPGLEPGRLALLEKAFKELNGRLAAVNSAQSAQITGVEAQVQAMSTSVSALERTVIDLICRATLLEACPTPEASVSGSEFGAGGAAAAERATGRDTGGNGWPLGGMAGMRLSTYGLLMVCIFAQDVAVEMVARAGILSADDELREGHSDVVVNRRRFFCYVDNIGILGLSSQTGSGMLWQKSF